MEQFKLNYDIFTSTNVTTKPLNVHFSILLQLNNMNHMKMFNLFILLKKFPKTETTNLLSSIVFLQHFCILFSFEGLKFKTFDIVGHYCHNAYYNTNVTINVC